MVAPGALGFKYHVTLVANWHNVQPVLFSVAVVMVVFLCLLSTANAFESLGAWEVSIFDSSLDRFSGSIFFRMQKSIHGSIYSGMSFSRPGYTFEASLPSGFVSPDPFRIVFVPESLSASNCVWMIVSPLCCEYFLACFAIMSIAIFSMTISIKLAQRLDFAALCTFLFHFRHSCKIKCLSRRGSARHERRFDFSMNSLADPNEFDCFDYNMGGVPS